MKFSALVVTESPPGVFESAVVERELLSLPTHDTLIRVHWSSLNYKDALSYSGNKGITRQYPHTPGVDAAGEIVESPEFAKGTEVIVVGFDLGMNTSGGLSQYIRVPSAWVIPKPPSLSLRDCMVLGTAGFTAAQCLYRMRQFGLTPDKGDVLVTGATGGVVATSTWVGNVTRNAGSITVGGTALNDNRPKGQGSVCRLDALRRLLDSAPWLRKGLAGPDMAVSHPSN
jgi:alcohol dehydrogenase